MDEPTIKLELTVEEAGLFLTLVGGSVPAPTLERLKEQAEDVMWYDEHKRRILQEIGSRTLGRYLPAHTTGYEKLGKALDEIDVAPAEPGETYYTVEATYKDGRSRFSRGTFSNIRVPDRFTSREAAEQALGHWVCNHIIAAQDSTLFVVVEHQTGPKPARFVRRES